jgi:hypothetical protein
LIQILIITIVTITAATMRAGYCMFWYPKKYWPPKEDSAALVEKYEI